ncbi:hypothetical protein ACFZCY_01450 [Streptomyces sp. NPDC007983]|uniref:hypothetical protein n=1 Tax=Streptomyces sp. NPDC007983 TaxID=3364800 RepID=UPI0036EFE762
METHRGQGEGAGAGACRCGGAGECRRRGAGARRAVARALVRRREALDPGALARLRRFGEALSRGERPF